MAVYNVSKARSKITGTSSNDRITNSGYVQVTMVGGAGKDTILNYGSYASIDGGAGHDYIYNYNGDDSSIVGGAGNDTIYNNDGDYATIIGGAGNDSIVDYYGYHVSINGGTGNDIISLASNTKYATIGYNSGDGNDKIFGMDSNDIFNVTGSWSSVKSGSNVVVKIGSSKVTLVGAYGKGVQIVENKKVTVKSANSNLTTGSGYDSIYNSGYSKVKISTGAGNDSIYNKGASVTVNAGNGDDSVTNTGRYLSLSTGYGMDIIINNGSHATIDAGYNSDYVGNTGNYSSLNAGDGDDYIYNYQGDYATIIGGAGDDSIYDYYGYYGSINAGTGNDIISLASNTKYATIGYNSGDGNDTVYGMDSNDVLSITGSWSSVKSGSNVILTVGSGKITLMGAANKSVKIVGNKRVTVTSANQNVTTGTGNDYVYNSGYSKVKITTGAGNDEIYNSGTRATINAGDGSDYVYNDSGGSSSKIDTGTGNDSVYNYGSHVVINTGTGNDSIYNYGEYTTVNAGAGNDTIMSHDAEWGSIYAGKGNDLISLSTSNRTNYDRNVTIGYTNGDGNDTIYNFNADDVLNITGGTWSSVKSGSNTIVKVGSGRIYLMNYTPSAQTGQKVTVTSANSNITTGNGNDTIYNPRYKSVKISSGAGNDSIVNSSGSGYYSDSVTIDAGAGNDTIISKYWNEYVSINAGTGNDLISLESKTYHTTLSYGLGDGNDTVYGFDSSDVLNITGGTWSSVKSGSNTIVKVGSDRIYLMNYTPGQKVTVSSTYSNVTTGSGNDTIYNPGYEHVKISSGAGNDSIVNDRYTSSNRWADSVTIDAGAGNDTIVSKIDNYYVSINGGTGNDVVSLVSSSKYTTLSYKNGDGNDTVYGLNSDDVIRIASGSWSSQKSGNDVILNVGFGKISLVGAGSGAIQVAVGNAKATTINAAVGQTISSSKSYSLISGGAGNDSIKSTGNYSTLDGGAGNDTLTGHDSGVDIFQYSGGNDVVTNYSGEDKIQIASGKVTDWSFNKGDLILKIGNSGTMTLKNMTNHYITVSDSTGTSTKLYSNGATSQSVIKTIVSSLKNNLSETNYTKALDKAIQATKTTVFTGIQSALNKFKSDFTSSGGGDNFLRNYCGIILDNADTGAITGWDAGGRYVKTAASIVPESGSVKTAPKSSFTKSGWTLNYSSSLTNVQQNIVNGLYSWWVDSAVNLIQESYGLKVNSKSMNLNLYSANDGTLAAVSYHSYLGTRLVNPYQLDVNTYYYPITTLDQNGISTKGEEYLDRTIAHEMTHAVQDMTFGKLPRFFTEGIAELTHGIDDARSTLETISNSSSKISTAINSALNFDGSDYNYEVGYMFWRYLGKQIADNYSSSSSYSKLASNSSTTVKTSKQVISDSNSDYNSSLWGGMSSNSTLQSAMTSLDDNLTVQDNLSSIDLGLSVDDISRQFSNNEGLILADNSNSSLNMLDTSNITFGIQQKKNLI